MADIESRNRPTQMQCGRANQEILEGNSDAFNFQFSFDSPGQLRDLDRHGIHGHVPAKLLDESQPPLSVVVGPGTIRSVDQFGNADDREPDASLIPHNLVRARGFAELSGLFVRWQR